MLQAQALLAGLQRERLLLEPAVGGGELALLAAQLLGERLRLGEQLLGAGAGGECGGRRRSSR
ncbi:hypothetical protein OV079_45460 [Nannocystis pusilla]|uniref:Uncharacterized protein n=1 Tax=Nannocystis pusilla TaxID=889268 RepID=A0A9X3EYE4_9BACT|nr:hypothetical protein [Nannocystis pusilla]MCY1012664.1 hypothetical protein [Nannocystis pusilla]